MAIYKNYLSLSFSPYAAVWESELHGAWLHSQHWTCWLCCGRLLPPAGHAVNTCWSCCEHLLVTLCTPAGHAVYTCWSRCVHLLVTLCTPAGHAVYTCWSRCEHLLVTLWTPAGHAVNTCWSRCEHLLVTLCTPAGHAVNTCCQDLSVWNLLVASSYRVFHDAFLYQFCSFICWLIFVCLFHFSVFTSILLGRKWVLNVVAVDWGIGCSAR